MQGRVFVHVSLDLFEEKAAGDKSLEDWLAVTATLDRVLGRHASGWTRPSVDEAAFAGPVPWGADGSPLDWADALRRDLASELCLGGRSASVGIAATRVAARICSRIARPSGILLWMEGRERGLFEGLPLEELDELRPDQLSRLRSQGIRTLDELGSLTSGEARALMGAEGEKLVGLVRGLDDVTGTDAGGLERAVDLLARRLERRLFQERRRARGLELSIVYADGVTRERYLLLPRPTSSAADLRQAAMQLVDAQPRRRYVVGGLALTATGLTGASSQLELFDAEGPRELRVNVGYLTTQPFDSAFGPRLSSREPDSHGGVRS
jgi:DNA polymerase-4